MTPAQFLDATDLFPDAALLVTSSGTVLAANPAVATQLGLRPEVLQGRALAGFLSTPPSQLAEYLRACSRSKQKVLGSLTVRQEDSPPTICRVEGKVVRPRTGDMEALVMLRVAPREEAVSHFLLLNQRVEHLSREIQRRQEAEEALREADRRKDEWIAMLAHELRGPLSPIRNGVQVLQLRGPADPDFQRARELVIRQIEHLARIIDDLLDVTRITRGQMQLRKERLDLVRLVRTTADDFGPALQQAGLALRLQLPATPVWVEGDATRLVQVLSNLLDNACKFTEPGGQIEVRLETDTPGSEATLGVRDSGAGIPPEMTRRLFEPLSQADRSLHRSKGGLGLGLALVKGLTALHGGTVAARSEGPGRGAEFLVRLPLLPEPAALTRVAAPVPSDAQRQRILIIEDNRDSADSLRLLLSLLGHEVQVAYTGPEGVQIAFAWEPDVVLSDIGLPGLDGYGVARELRRNPGTSKARLIAITGYGREDDRRLAEESGFERLLTKPAEPAVLLQLLSQPRPQ